MTNGDAAEIATLINRRNQLVHQYDAAQVLANAPQWEFEVRDGQVVACVERKRVQWYQWEISHLSVDEAWEGKGLAFKVYSRAVAAAEAGGARLLQCTIRVGNKQSQAFFKRQDFVKIAEFYYSGTGNDVAVWQKVLFPPRREQAAEQ